jgi:hypothetical protein
MRDWHRCGRRAADQPALGYHQSYKDIPETPLPLMSRFLYCSRLTPILLDAVIFAGAAVVSPAQQNVGELFASDASVKGGVILANSGTKVMSGSSIAAGEQTATLKLERGGTMLICPGTSLAVTTSQNGRQLMFSMNAGNIEMDYPIGAASDNLLTPDFRLLLPGPGRLHLAVRVTAKGDTCVQSLASNSSAVVVSEGMEDASYQVKPNEAVIFNGGRISGAMPTRESCGCPAPPPTQVAKVTPPPEPKAETPKSDPPPPETHMVVDAPFIYRAEDPVDLSENVAHLHMETKPMNFDPVVLPPSASTKSAKPVKTETAANTAKPQQQKQGFFGKVGAFFAAIFR